MSRRAAFLPALAALVLTTAGCAGGDQPAADPKPSVSVGRTEDGVTGGGDAAGISFADAVGRLALKPEHTGGYERDAFEHWNTGVDPDDGCDTREELLIAEAVKPPTRGEGCKLTGGQWLSYYDETTVTEPGKLDVDHMVALEEAWSSGAHAWNAEQREAYANDLEAPRSLVAVTARTNRSKGKRDVAEWLPPATGALCTYLEDWTATKLRWNLSTDQTEHDTLVRLTKNCPDSAITYKPAR